MAKRCFSVLGVLIVTSLVAGIRAVHAQERANSRRTDKTMAAAHESFVKKDMNKAAEQIGKAALM